MAEDERKKEAALDALPELETACEHCRGKYADCHRCGGTGFIPTAFGKKVLALVRHNVRLDSAAILFHE